MKVLKASALLSAVLILTGCSGGIGSAKGSGVSTMAAALRLE